MAVLLVWQLVPIAYLSWYLSPRYVAAQYGAGPEGSQSQQLEHLQFLRDELSRLSAAQQLAQATDAKLQVLDQLLSSENPGLPDAASQLAARQQQIQRLEATILGLDSQRRESERQLVAARAAVESTRRESERTADETRRELAVAMSELKKLQAENQNQRNQLLQLLAAEESLGPSTEGKSFAWITETPAWTSPWGVMLAVGLFTLFLVGIAFVIGIRAIQGKRMRAAEP